MRIHTVVSDSHRPLLEIYEASLRRVEPDADLVVHEIGQHGTGEYGTEGYLSALLEKLVTMRRIAATETGPYIFAECDIVWLRPFIDGMCDILENDPGSVFFQKHGHYTNRWACTGLYITPGGDVLAPVLEGVANLMPVIRDEEAALRKFSEENPWRWGYLPDRFWTQGILGKRWNAGNPIDLPPDAACFHASWTIGISNKKAMMELALGSL